MSAFWASPISRVQDEIVKAKVVAINERGSSQPSEANTSGSSIEVKPHKMIAVLEGSDTSNLQIHTTWDPLVHPENGSSVITSFNL